MLTKKNIAYFIFTLSLLYIASPWIFEKYFLFNELLAATGVGILLYKRFGVGKDAVSVLLIVLIGWGGVHAVTSLFRMDSIYYYFRNLVIVYSMFAFFIGYYLLDYLGGFINRIRSFLRLYIGIFIFVPLSKFWFERYGMATLFPALFRRGTNRMVLPLLILLCIIYAVSYRSSTSFVLALFYMLIFVAPGYRFFKVAVMTVILGFAMLFYFLQPNLGLIRGRYNFYDEVGIRTVMKSHPILNLDGNNTWRLVLWNQLVVDRFPKNVFGLGFGTPAMTYYPIADYSKLESLPYVMGAHNSFVYLFSRLGIVYLFLICAIYAVVFREYFRYKDYYRSNNQILIFWSFFAITMISLFNPTLETPIYAGGYWMMMGFTARCISRRMAYQLVLQRA